MTQHQKQLAIHVRNIFVSVVGCLMLASGTIRMLLVSEESLIIRIMQGISALGLLLLFLLLFANFIVTVSSFYKYLVWYASEKKRS